MSDHPESRDWWRNRRRLAHWAMAAAILETAALFWLPLPEAALWPTYGLWGTVIGAYMGTAIWDDVVARRLGQR
ncbi:hypothetical protein [Halomonas koreensis]|uniref:2TM domain-containing protein n=1 Tax=Halomonas koreensis TaxID=245385 RepID=A0ABU1G2W3_9GAMM|nr:hypothetical protein [Halomonas koreensis]MDR5867287.1 hypothetical protein [Halomonas koreensis]